MNKKKGTIQVFTDFYDLNQAYPKENFPTLFIDKFIDECVIHEVLSFMDGFLGYNQIWIHQQDQYNIAFTTPWDTFAYCIMPFGLKNARATFEHAMSYVFLDLTSMKWSQHLEDLFIFFLQYRQYNIRLNPLKHFFYVMTHVFYVMTG